MEEARMTQFLVSRIMQPVLVTVTPDMPIRRAAALLDENDTPVAPVTRDGTTLIGILTQKDCFRPALHASYHQEWAGTAKDFMSDKVVSVDIECDLVRAAELFLEHPHRVLPVMDRGRLVGLLDRSDVLKQLLQNG